MSSYRVWLGHVTRDVRDLKRALGDISIFTQIDIPRQSRVIVKPNFTWPGWKPGVTTHPALLAALAEFFVDYGNEVIFVESDGGMHSWKVEEAFAGHGLYTLEEKFGGKVRCLSLMQEDVQMVGVFCWGKYSKVPVPRILLDSQKFFVTCPVLKTHCMTETSLAFKNQWGCLPDTYRLRFHHVLGKALVKLADLVHVDLAIVDGLIALDGNGPMFGEPVDCDVLIGGADPGAVSRIACEVMGLRWWKSRVLRAAATRGKLPRLEDITTSQAYDNMLGRRFVSKKLLPNYAAIVIAYSRLLTWLFYLSPFRPIIASLKRRLFGSNEITRGKPQCPY